MLEVRALLQQFRDSDQPSGTDTWIVSTPLTATTPPHVSTRYAVAYAVAALLITFAVRNRSGSRHTPTC